MSDLILPPSATRRQIAPNKFEYSLFPRTAVVQKSDMGAPMIRTSDSHKVYKFRSQRFWAEGGRIYIVDDRDDEFASCSIEEFGSRAVALVGQATQLCQMNLWSDERAELIKAVGDMKRVIYDAKEQGDPHDPAVLAYKLRQRGRKVSVGYTKASARPYKDRTGQPLAGRVVGEKRPGIRFN